MKNQLLEEKGGGGKKDKKEEIGMGRKQRRASESEIKAFLEGTDFEGGADMDDNEIYRSKPIASLFPNTTILFGKSCHIRSICVVLMCACAKLESG